MKPPLREPSDTEARAFDWSGDDRYENNNGSEYARILAVHKINGTWEVRMERWKRRRAARRTGFAIPLRFFLSKSCGWRLK